MKLGLKQNWLFKKKCVFHASVFLCRLKLLLQLQVFETCLENFCELPFNQQTKMSLLKKSISQHDSATTVFHPSDGLCRVFGFLLHFQIFFLQILRKLWIIFFQFHNCPLLCVALLFKILMCRNTFARHCIFPGVFNKNQFESDFLAPN